MVFKQKCIAGVMGWILVAGVLAAPAELAGVRLDPQIELANGKLLLNGAGIRYKAIFKVFVTALYLSKSATTEAEAYAAPGPKRIAITLLRDVNGNAFGKGFVKNFGAASSKSEMSKLVPGLIKMGQLFSDQKVFVKGDTVFIDWIPGTGTVISIRGVAQGEPSKEVEFFNTTLAMWIGGAAEDLTLKDGLLGHSQP